MAAEGDKPWKVLVFARWRQWGRGRMAAEGINSMRTLARICSVNGAAAGWPRKAKKHVEIVHQGPASMGPRPDGRGRRIPRRPVRGRLPCVNGAAAGWPRKEYAAARSMRLVKTRQWGRGRMAAEGMREMRMRRGQIASMGPRPDGRGRLYSPFHCLTISWRVNGAAAGWPRKEHA